MYRLFALPRFLRDSLRRSLRREEASSMLEAQLRKDRELESLGRMASRFAHDFNNLLTVVIGYSDALLSQLQAGDPMQDDLHAIREAAERAAGLIARMVTASGRQAAQPCVLDLNVIVSGIKPLLESLLGADIELTVVLDPAPCWVMADPAQLRQVLTNLALNAREAMPARGTLTVATANPDGDLRGSVRLTVSDTGTGVAEDVLPHLFEPFVTTKRAIGAGLGLAEAYGIVKQNGGRITVSSIPGRGSAFGVYLPCVSPPPVLSEADAAGLANAPQTASPALEGCAVLIADDEPAVRKLIRQALAPYGCTILDAGSGEEALSAAAVFEGKINVAIVDFVLPGLNGLDLALQLERNFPALKTLYVSSAIESIGMASLLRHAPERVLLKPFTADQVAERVLGLARGRA